MISRVPVFVCGEPARGDDDAGFAAVELLPPDVRARAEIVAVGQLDVLLLLDLPADEPCVVVDAVAGLAPGETWVRPLAALVARAAARAGAGPRGHAARRTAGRDVRGDRRRLLGRGDAVDRCRRRGPACLRRGDRRGRRGRSRSARGPGYFG